METGDLSEWYAGSGGGEYNDATGDSIATKEKARTGLWSAKLGMSDSYSVPTSATRLFRWKEPVAERDLYYSVWYYFPQRYKTELYGWNNWMQYKSATTDGKHDPFFILGTANRPTDGSMYFTLNWWNGLKIEGPAPTQYGGRTWGSPVNVPEGRWVHVQVRYVCAGDFSGKIQVWQDGTQIFNLEGVKTRYDNGNCQWSVNSYGAKMTPSSVFFYVDDLEISRTPIVPITTPPLWTAGMETGDLRDWYAPCTAETHSCTLGSGGGEYNDATGDSIATQEKARTGLWSAKLSMTNSNSIPTSATRLFRWKEPAAERDLYYSAWYYFPQRYTTELYGWNNWMQYKSATTDGKHDPFFILGTQNRQTDGSMYFTLNWWNGLQIEGPAPSQYGGRTWGSPINVPEGRWVHVQVRYVCAGDFTGKVQVWQDGAEIFNLDGVKTRYDNGNCQWSVNNYGAKMTPNPVVFYVDDVKISRTPVAP